MWYCLLSLKLSFFQSEVCKKILRDLGQADVESEKRKVIILSQESFYRDLNAEESAQADAGDFNFDHPGLFASFTLKYLKTSPPQFSHPLFPPFSLHPSFPHSLSTLPSPHSLSTLLSAFQLMPPRVHWYEVLIKGKSNQFNLFPLAIS